MFSTGLEKCPATFKNAELVAGSAEAEPAAMSEAVDPAQLGHQSVDAGYVPYQACVGYETTESYCDWTKNDSDASSAARHQKRLTDARAATPKPSDIPPPR